MTVLLYFQIESIQLKRGTLDSEVSQHLAEESVKTQQLYIKGG